MAKRAFMKFDEVGARYHFNASVHDAALPFARWCSADSCAFDGIE
jgi:hypothetical protein